MRALRSGMFSGALKSAASCLAASTAINADKRRRAITDLLQRFVRDRRGCCVKRAAATKDLLRVVSYVDRDTRNSRWLYFTARAESFAGECQQVFHAHGKLLK